MNYKFICLALCLSHLSYSSEVIVTADKISKDIKSTTNSVTVISSEDIRNSSAQTIEDLLQSTAGVYLSSNGALGGVSVLRIRGTGRGFSKIVIDGMELNDPTDIDNSFQINQLSLENIESIEILRGSQSTIYGSNSIGGVVKITTKQSLTPLSSVKIGYGTYDSKSVGFTTSGKSTNQASYSLSGSFFDTDGISRYKNESAEKDRFSKINLSGKISKKLQSLKVTYQIHVIKSDTEIDDYNSDVVDKDNSSYDQDMHLITLENRFFEDKLLSKTSLKYMEINRDSAGTYPSKTIGKEKGVSWEGSLFHSPQLTTVFGFDYNFLKADNQYDFVSTTRHSITNTSLFISTNYIIENYTLDLAIREDRNSIFKNYETWKIGGSYLLSNSMRLKTNYATGYKAPTIYQTYAGTRNKDLKPTESLYYDFSASYRQNQLELNFTYFNYNFKNQITYNNGHYENISKSEIKGLETELILKASKALTIGSAITIQRAVNKETTKYLDKTPRLLIKSFLQINSAIKSNFEFVYVGERNDSGALPSYILLNSSFTYDHLKLSINNILNKEYEDTRSYTMPGRNIFASYVIDL